MSKKTYFSLQYFAGQAMAESLLTFLLLIVLFIGISWIGRLLDVSFQQENASRYGAFQLTRRLDHLDEKAIKQQFFLSDEHQWSDQKGRKIITADNIAITQDQSSVLGDDAQAGKHQARQLRTEWGIQDKGIAEVLVRIQPHYTPHKTQGMSLGMDSDFFEKLGIGLERKTAILVDAAHSISAREAHRRTGQSDLAWRKVAERSYALGRKIQSKAEKVEGFSRPAAIFDWLMPWAEHLPIHHRQGKMK